MTDFFLITYHVHKILIELDKLKGSKKKKQIIQVLLYMDGKNLKH